MPKRKSIPIKYRKLGKEKAIGLAHSEGIIEVDERLRGKKQLEIIIHEALHILFPRLSENKVVEQSIILTNTLWKQGYRRIDNDNSQPLQDGSK